MTIKLDPPSFMASSSAPYFPQVHPIQYVLHEKIAGFVAERKYIASRAAVVISYTIG